MREAKRRVWVFQIYTFIEWVEFWGLAKRGVQREKEGRAGEEREEANQIHDGGNGRLFSLLLSSSKLLYKYTDFFILLAF